MSRRAKELDEPYQEIDCDRIALDPQDLDQSLLAELVNFFKTLDRRDRKPK